MRTFSDSEVEDELRALIKAAGNVSRFSKHFEYSQKAVWNVLHGKRPIAASLAKILGYEPVLPITCRRTGAHRPMKWKRINP